MKEMDEITGLLACPRCRGVFTSASQALICSICGLSYPIADQRIFFVSPPSDAPRSHTSTDPRGWSAWRRANFEYFRRELAAEPKDGVLVDLGTGASQFRSLTDRFRLLVGVDFYPYERAVVVADISKPLPFRDQCCDIIFLSNVLDHLSHPRECLAECRRILRPGGRIVGTVAFLLHVNQMPYDFFRYTGFGLERMLAEAGFTAIRVEPLGAPADVYRTVQRHFFHLLFASSLASWARFASRGAWAATRMLDVLLAPISRRIPPSSVYTEGYGFSALC